ncbi:UNVERIFIED_CONTAM: hypothetical protein Sindi_1744100 [Sesamum indicum]
MSQLASSISRLESQVEKSYNSKIVLGAQQGKIKDENSVVRRHAEQDKTEHALEIPPKQAKKPNQVSKNSSKVFVPKPPFPEIFAKSKEEEEEKEILEIKQIPRYAKFLV